MRLTALGVHSAFSVGEVVNVDYPATADHPAHTRKLYDPKFHSNFLLEFDQGKSEPYRFLFDMGGDIRHSSMYSANLRMGAFDAVYVSHNHNDHVGGIEGIALSTFFNPMWRKHKTEWLKAKGDLNILELLMKEDNLEFPPDCKPELFGHRDVLSDTWKTAAPGLKTLQGEMSVNLNTYFNVRPMTTNVPKKIKDGAREWTFYTVESTHVMSGTSSMPTYGLMWECSDGQKIYMPADTMLLMPPSMRTFYVKADVVYQDTETEIRSGVHSFIDDIEKADPEIKKKMYLYHYSKEPKVDETQYRGILRMGDVHEY